MRCVALCKLYPTWALIDQPSVAVSGFVRIPELGLDLAATSSFPGIGYK